MRYLYYCNSAYQLIDILNIHWQRKNNNFENIIDYHADLILLDAFSGAKEILERIKKDNVFDNARLIKRCNNSGLLHVFQSFFDIAIPSYFIKRGNGIKKSDVFNKYDYLVVNKFSRITAAIWQLNKDAKLQIHEDGIGTYIFDLEKSLVSKSKSYIYLYKLFNYGRTFLDYESIYLNEPDFYNGNNKERIKQIPKYDKSYINKITEYFPSNIENDESKRIYWLLQHSFEDSINEKTDKILREYSEKVVYCPHPRYPSQSEVPYSVSPKGQIWEIKALNMKNIEDCCLISVSSTACLTPKLLFDKEPYVVLTFDLLNGDSKDNLRFKQMIDVFITKYKNPNKILVPKNIDEYKEFINKIIKE